MVTLREDQYTFPIISRSVLLRMRNVSDKCCTENKKKSIFMFKNFFFRKSRLPWDNVEKYCTAGQDTDDMCIAGYRHTLRICNTNRFSTATVVSRTRLNITVIRTLPVTFRLKWPVLYLHLKVYRNLVQETEVLYNTAVWKLCTFNHVTVLQKVYSNIKIPLNILIL